MNINLNNKHAVISGSTLGIGYAIAHGLAAAGASVVINGRGQASVTEAVAKLKASFPTANIQGVAADLGTAQGVADFVTQVPTTDILINNLGIFEPKSFFDVTDEEWDKFFQVNVMSAVRLSRHYAPGMASRKWGRIQFISSESAMQMSTDLIHYGMTKTALLAISRGLAETMVGTGVTVNAILPGPTKTEGMATFLEQIAKEQGTTPEKVEADFFRDERPSSLIQRLITPEEVANLAVYLASTEAAATTGAAVRVDGGIVRSVF